jgi:hypothetical protein
MQRISHRVDTLTAADQAISGALAAPGVTRVPGLAGHIAISAVLSIARNIDTRRAAQLVGRLALALSSLTGAALGTSDVAHPAMRIAALQIGALRVVACCERGVASQLTAARNAGELCRTGLAALTAM